MKSICIITSKYPTIHKPTALVFVQQLAWTLADMDIKVTIICPISVNIEGLKGLQLPYKTNETTEKNNVIEIYFPKYVGFGQRNFSFFNTASLSLEGFSIAAIRVINSLSKKPDVIYGHFISPSGVVAARIGKKFNIPSFVAYGESSPWSVENLGVKKVIKELKNINGVVAVSTKNKDELINLGIIDKEKIGVSRMQLGQNIIIQEIK